MGHFKAELGIVCLMFLLEVWLSHPSLMFTNLAELSKHEPSSGKT